MSRPCYEVRVRENGTKRSKFYYANGPSEAAHKYRGLGSVMWVQKVGKERVFGIGSFFTLGDRLLNDLKNGGGDPDVDLPNLQEMVRPRSKQRGYHDNRRAKTTNAFRGDGAED